MIILAIDPGYAIKGPGCACALFVDQALAAAWYARPGRPHPTAPDGCTIVWEQPQVRPKEDVSPGKANTLIRLAAEGALLAGQYAGETSGVVVAVAPAQWKGATPKPVCHKRLWERLTIAEQVLLARALGGNTVAIATRIADACRRGGLNRWAKPGHAYYGAWPHHNLLDAVGIGRWYLESKNG